jgi:hypothetical protein
MGMSLRDEVLFDRDLAQRGRRVCRTADDGKVPDSHDGRFSLDESQPWNGGMAWTTVLASWKSVMASGPRRRPTPLCL